MKSPSNWYVEQPVRSDFASRSRGGVRHPLRPVWIGLLIAMIGGGVYWTMNRAPEPQDIPTLKAEGVVKERPDQPGGIDIPHQDMLVFQQIEGGDSKAQKLQQQQQQGEEHLLPPPVTPQPQPKQTSTAAQSVAPPESLMETNEGTATPSVAPAPAVASPTQVREAVQAPAPVQPTTVSPIQAAPVVAPAKEVVKKEEKPIAAAPIAAVSSPVQPAAKAPAQQPAKPQTAAQVVQKVQETEHLPTELFTTGAKATETAGSSASAHIQLASVGDQASAQSMLAKLQSKFATALGGVKLKLVKASLAKGTFYRIQGDVASEAEAKRICAKIQSSSGSCILAK